MHLRDRGRGDRPVVERGEQLGERAARARPRSRRAPRRPGTAAAGPAAPTDRAAIASPSRSAAHRQRLAELDEDRAQRLQRPRQPLARPAGRAAASRARWATRTRNGATPAAAPTETARRDGRGSARSPAARAPLRSSRSISWRGPSRSQAPAGVDRRDAAGQVAVADLLKPAVAHQGRERRLVGKAADALDQILIAVVVLGDPARRARDDVEGVGVVEPCRSTRQ